jgi:hypothetical protein
MVLYKIEKLGYIILKVKAKNFEKVSVQLCTVLCRQNM